MVKTTSLQPSIFFSHKDVFLTAISIQQKIMKHQQDMLPRCVTPIVSHFETGSEENQVSLFALFNAECFLKSFLF